MLVDGTPLPGISASRTIYVDRDGNIHDGVTPEREIAILGLESDKMRLEMPLSNSSSYRGQYLGGPLERSGQLLADYSGDAPEVVVQRLMGHLASHWSKIKGDKPR